MRALGVNQGYTDGSTKVVSRVDVMIPPMTTVANGRWISAPG